ncbi:RTA1-like protein 10 [Elsinoe fawcettii]|nr:RTA1-like protein 10 [Elsinoe fawcettii]
MATTTRRVQGFVPTNFPNPMGPNDASIVIYGYVPSLAVGVLGVVLFALLFVLHLLLLLRHRTWYFTPVLVGTFMEIVGYVFRLLSGQKDPYNIIYFVIQYFFIVVAPVFFSAAIYTIVSGLINKYGRKYSPLSPKVILWVFIVCDVVTTIVQVAGAALVGKAYSNQKDPTTPNHILLAGLAIQVFTFAAFLAVLAWTLWRAKASPTRVSHAFLASLVVATLAIYLRTCFRLAETAEGLMKELSTHEVYFGCLEFAPVVVAVTLLGIWHPGRCLQKGRVAEKPASAVLSDSV